MSSVLAFFAGVAFGAMAAALIILILLFAVMSAKDNHEVFDDDDHFNPLTHIENGKF